MIGSKKAPAAAVAGPAIAGCGANSNGQRLAAECSHLRAQAVQSTQAYVAPLEGLIAQAEAAHDIRQDSAAWFVLDVRQAGVKCA